MKKLLKYIGENQWSELFFKKDIESEPSVIVKKNTQNHTSNDINVINEVKASIKKTGYRSIKISVLFGKFGYKRRGKSNIEFIQHLFLDNGLYFYPALDDENNKWDTSIQVYSFPVEYLGDLFKTEIKLEDFIDKTNALSKLGITNTIRQYSPMRTKDRLDFKGTSRKQNIVIELKHEDGGKRAVEQVLRYAGMLKQEEPNKSVRKILITGVRGLATAKALYGMTKEQKKDFEWYLYKYDKEKKTIEFERVTNQYIERNLKLN